MKSKLSERQLSWLWISGIAFLLCLAAAAGLVLFGKRLEDLGIVGNVYYIILIPLGFSCAAFLSGAMKSYASYTSNESLTYGKLSLAGPIVIFVLVIGGGFIMPKFSYRDEEFDPKFKIVSDGEQSSSFNEGVLYLDLVDQVGLKGDIHEGQALVSNIPIRYLGKNGKVAISIDNYELDMPSEIVLSKKCEIKVRRTDQSLNTTLRGSITTEKNTPLRNAFLNFGSGLVKVSTDENGDFLVKIPLPPGDRIKLNISIHGVLVFSNNITLSDKAPLNLQVKENP